MILLDTNVLSESLKPAPSASVLEWLEGQPRPSLFTTTLTRAELLHGLCLLPLGARRSRLEAAVRDLLAEGFAGRVIEFDSGAAEAYADIACSRKAEGRPISQTDAMIAAIAKSRGAELATRNTSDFEGCGITLIDPWRH